VIRSQFTPAKVHAADSPPVKISHCNFPTWLVQRAYLFDPIPFLTKLVTHHVPLAYPEPSAPRREGRENRTWRLRAFGNEGLTSTLQDRANASRRDNVLKVTCSQGPNRLQLPRHPRKPDRRKAGLGLCNAASRLISGTYDVL
jgi:hypothetical protein